MASQQRRKMQKKKARQQRVKQKQSVTNVVPYSIAHSTNLPMPKILRPTGFGMPNMSAELPLFLITKLLEQHGHETINEANAYLNTLMDKSPEVLADLAQVESDPRTHAQYLAYQGYLAEDDLQADRLIDQALELDPECTDALLFRWKTTIFKFGELKEIPIDQLLQAMASRSQDALRLVEIAEKRLGPEYFEQWHGEFWNIPSRPYMRVLREHGKLLCADGDNDQARVIYEKMLNLNPNDNQGVRDSLLSLYLEQGDTAAARELFIKYPKDVCAVFCFGRVLERWLSRDFVSAIRLLKEARRDHPFVEECLLDPESVPDDLPEYFLHGEWEEAIYCAVLQLTAWETHEASLDWLEEQINELDA